MPKTWTPEQVLSLAPDEASRKSARPLAIPGLWLRLLQEKDQAPTLLWGEFVGSGSSTYRTQVRLDDPAFACSCPSRKRPCKHALGLLLLFASQPEAFSTGAPPNWVVFGLARRLGKSATAENASPLKTSPGDRAKARRSAARDQKIRAGLDELETWLRDMLRQGLAAAQSQPRPFWEACAARLVDAQAPGLARLVRNMAGMALSGDGWQDRLLDQVARLALAIEGYRRIDTLPEATQADLRSLVGIVTKQEDVLRERGARDTWVVLGRAVEEEAGLKNQRVWLLGQSTRRFALILSFAPAGAPLDASLLPGTCLRAEAVYYPGACPLRALLRAGEPPYGLPVAQHPALPASESLESGTAGYASALAANPWLERWPVALRSVTLSGDGTRWALHDAYGRWVPLARTFTRGWTLQAVSGGWPLSVFGEWNGETLCPLSAWTAEQFYDFPAAQEDK